MSKEERVKIVKDAKTEAWEESMCEHAVGIAKACKAFAKEINKGSSEAQKNVPGLTETYLIGLLKQSATYEHKIKVTMGE